MRRTTRATGIMSLCALIAASSACGDGTDANNSASTVGNNDNDTGAVGPLADAEDQDTEYADMADAGEQKPDAVAQDAEDAADTATDTVDATADIIAPINCPGGEGCDCAANDECDNSVCLTTSEGKKCAKTCVETCDKGWTCTTLGAKDSVFVCVPNFVTLCAPCQKSVDCELQGVKSLCLDYGDKGRFCGGPCKDDDSCPKGYTCAEAEDGEGVKSKQCKMADGGACACTGWAIESGAQMDCTVDNEFGACPGTQKCTKDGMGPCDGDKPAEEVCDGIDSDCDGKTDILPKTAKCSLKSFTNDGSKAVCKADADCTAQGEACDEQAGVCKKLIGECFGTPICTVSGNTECTKVKTAKPESCNLEDDDCDGSTDEDFGWTHPVSGDIVAVGGNCGEGPCAGGQVKCSSLIKAACDSEDKIAKEKCDGVDNDCDGKLDDGACEDGDECTIDTCDGKACSNTPGDSCDDNNACTADSCDKVNGKCVNKDLSGDSCDDGDACTVGDLCGAGDDGKAACLAGKEGKVCDDKNPCTDDSCAPDKGCVNLANAVTEACYSGDPKTEGAGPCKGGTKFCKEGKLEATCVAEVAPSLFEACDGKDDDCDGVTDEGCKAEQVELSFAAAFGDTAGGKKKMLLEVSGTSPAGRAQSGNKTGEFGFIAWLAGWMK